MRNTLFGEIKTLLCTLKNAHTKFNFNIIEEKPELLAQCQECAIAIGENIEESEGKGTESVLLLEEYCELLYHMSLSKSNSEWQAISRKIEDKIIQIMNSFQQITVVYEIIFLPYKASMWDSLESIWLAADADIACHCVVMPIPYFDNNADGTFGQMHYEGKEFPNYVPITSWKEYSIEKNRPDVIYIHNPYDQTNFVTSVFPDFYSKNLKKFTNMLIYIPYFVLNETTYNIDERKKLEHFCFLPGVIYADKVIVQSEDMRQIYIEEYCKKMKERGVFIEKNEIEKKILGLGSPKFDMIINTKIEDCEIPKSWLKKILRDDGKRKKIILYNTTINTFLNEDQKLFNKMKNVFSIFKSKKDSITLLWRPHPLLENTIKSMRPYLWEEYQEIVNLFKSEEWGIYDDTADLERAILLSDAYYGDFSSVAVIYKRLNKPLVIQDVNICYDKPTEDLCLSNILNIDGNYYAIAKHINGFWRLDLKKKQALLLSLFDNEKLWQKFLFEKILYYNNRIIFVPNSAANSYIYYIDENKMNLIKLPKCFCIEGKKFVDAVIIGKYCYMIPWNCLQIAILDLETEKIDVLSLEKYINIETFNENRAMFSRGNSYIDGTILIPIIQTKSMLEVNVNINKIYINLIKGLESDLKTVTLKEKQFFYLTDCIGNLYLYDKESQINIKLIKADKTDVIFDKVLYIKNRLLLFPAKNKNCIYVYNDSLNNIKKVDLDAIMLPIKDTNIFDGNFINDEEVFFMPSETRSIYRFDLEKNEYCLPSINYKYSILDYMNQVALSNSYGKEGMDFIENNINLFQLFKMLEISNIYTFKETSYSNVGQDIHIRVLEAINE